jgi:hypothetical protein
MMVKKSKPFPTKSSIYNQKNCMVSTNVVIVKCCQERSNKGLQN